ncbi:hypothetical protein X975_14219, partial [Stegodyphus mimosarum]
MGNEAYEEELIKSLLENITSVRLEKEERQERIRREDEERQDRIRREEREFEITKMKLQAAKGKDLIDGNEESMPRRNHFELQKMIQKFDPEENDVSLYLVMFERQAKRANLNQSEWVSVLLTLLPTEIVQLIMREPEEQAYDYAYIKGILLKRFKLSPEKFRIKFSQTQKNAQTTWRDFAFELRNYFEEWISGLEINDFELLKDLMITDQMKRRVNFEVRQHFIDEWSKITSPNKLAELLEDYENVREYRKKVSPVHGSESQKRNKNQPNFRDSPRYKQAGEKVSKKTETFRNQDERHFEVRKPLKCYTCGSIDHLRPQCPKAQKDFKSTAVVNRVQENEEDYLAPYTTMAMVNGFDLPVLWDSGASIDVICKKYITPSMLTGETVWAGSDWEQVLPAALLALRTVTHESTGFTPAELVHGKNLHTPEILLYEHWTYSPDEEQPVTEYVFRLINRLKKCQELAVEKMHDQQLRRKKWYDKNAIKREFKEGDLVLILATSKANKLSVQWTGPGKVENKVSETNYIVSLPGKKERSQIYHINMLKPYHKRPEVINYLSCSEEGSDQIETEIDFPNIDTNPNVYDYSEVIKSSNLEELLEPTQRDQLQRQDFIVQTDPNPLTWLRTNASTNPCLMRWALALQPYNFTIIHSLGKLNKNADALSRKT